MNLFRVSRAILPRRQVWNGLILRQRHQTFTAVASDEAASESTAPEGSATSDEPAPSSVVDVESVLSSHAVNLMPPAPWRRAGEWVDLVYERAGLPAEGTQKDLESPWDSDEFPHPDANVLWPHSSLNEHRSRPFSLPRQDSSPTTANLKGSNMTAEQQLAVNRERLTALWNISSSHGISWDELDDAYVQFAKAGKQRYDMWARRQRAAKSVEPSKEPKTEERKKPELKSRIDPEVLASRAYQEAQARAVNYLKRYCPDPAVNYPSRTRRLASRIYAEEKKKFLAPWKPGKLTAMLQQLVAARMCWRETEERAYGLVKRVDK